MTNFNKRTNTLLYKNIPLTLYSRKGDVSCVWEGSWKRGQTAILTQSSSDHSSTSSSFWLGCSSVGHRGRKPSVCKLILTLASCPPTDSNSNWNWPKPSVAPGYIIILCPPASAVPPLIYTGASLDWRLGRGSIYNIYLPISAYVWDATFFLFFEMTLIFELLRKIWKIKTQYNLRNLFLPRLFKLYF